MLIRSEAKSPVGALFLVEKDEAVVALGFAAQEPELTARLKARFAGETPRSGKARALGAVRAYLDGDLSALDEIEADPHGTDFQRRVWRELRTIRAGETRSYGEIAHALGDPRAVRAVGAANGRNPISLVIPCHRVIRSDGNLCGYAGGLEKKRWLLAHEAVGQQSTERADPKIDNERIPDA
jgi:methylated-DNA-[protein]-cysteine S-methyltransferase